MNIITGIIKNKLRVAGCGLRVKTAERIVHLLMVSTLILLIDACVSKQAATETEVVVKTDVKVSSPSIGNADRLLSFQAVTHYMQDNNIRTQLTGIITRINCTVAGNIHTGEALFVIQPQEAAALQKSKFSSQIISGLSDTVYSHLSGQIKSLNVQVGDFVQIGDVLASCIRANS
ncbi:MAG: biotin/lipoyl-binding protein, partial [Bacteroidota bacterium]|nr:biotin/lipoyl-binding protein [Bacteroidota bacterium]